MIIKVLLTGKEPEDLKEAVIDSNKLDGDMAEIGVFEGGSAKIICENTDKQVHLFDTFEGLPWEEAGFKKGIYKCSMNNAYQALSNHNNFFFYPGIFPDTAELLEVDKFSLVHIDCDLSKTVKDCLEYFYDKITSGGSILIHDMHSSPIKQVVAEFFKDKPEEDQVGKYRIVKC